MSGSGASRRRTVDGLRALAMLSVFAYHFGLRAPNVVGAAGGEMARVVPNLDIGVDVFFVLSGYLVYRPFAAANRAGLRGPGLGPYLVRRAARIYPAYLVALVVLRLTGAISLDGLGDWVRHVTLVHSWSEPPQGLASAEGLPVSWTLVIEVAFYLFVPVWAAAVRRLGPARPGLELAGCAGLSLFGFGARVLTTTDLSQPWMGALPWGLATLAAGMALAVIDVWGLAGAGTRPALRSPLGWWGAAAIVFVVLGRHSYTNPFFTFAALSDPGMRRWHALLGALVAVLLAVPVLLPWDGGRLRALLAHPGLAWLGVVSYGIYLWHEPILAQRIDVPEMFTTALLPSLGQGAVLLGVSVVAGALSWYGLERPSMRRVGAIGRGS